MPGTFSEDFSRHFFPQKRGEKIRRLIREKSRRLENKNPRKSVLPKTDPKNCWWKCQPQMGCSGHMPVLHAFRTDTRTSTLLSTAGIFLRTSQSTLWGLGFQYFIGLCPAHNKHEQKRQRRTENKPQTYYWNSCRSRFSGVYLVFEVFQDTWHSNKENPGVYWNATLSCPVMASNYAKLYLVPISIWSHSGCWPCLGFLSISFCRRASRFVAFQTKVTPLCFCLARIKLPLLICIQHVIASSVSEEFEHQFGQDIWLRRHCVSNSMDHLLMQPITLPDQEFSPGSWCCLHREHHAFKTTTVIA